MLAALPEELQLAAFDFVGGARLRDAVRLGNLSTSVCRLARESVQGLLYDSDPAVRLHATGAIIESAEVGQPDAAMLLLERAEDSDAQVCVTAVSALAYLVEPDDEEFPEAVAVVARLLQDDEHDVRQAAYSTLSMLTEQGSVEAVAAVVAATGSTSAVPREGKALDAEIRAEALEHLSNVALRGDAVALAAVMDCLDDVCDAVRHEAVAAFGQLAAVGDLIAVGRLCEFMQEPDEVVRRAAVVGISMVAPSGDQRSVAALVGRLQDSSSNVRFLALSALAEVAEPGDVAAHAGASNCREDANENVRNEAEKVSAYLTSRHCA